MEFCKKYVVLFVSDVDNESYAFFLFLENSIVTYSDYEFLEMKFSRKKNREHADKVVPFWRNDEYAKMSIWDKHLMCNIYKRNSDTVNRSNFHNHII